MEINGGQSPSSPIVQTGPAGPSSILIVEPGEPWPVNLCRVSAPVMGVSGSTGQDCSMSEKAIRTPPVASPKMLGNRAAAAGVATAAHAVS